MLNTLTTLKFKIMYTLTYFCNRYTQIHTAGYIEALYISANQWNHNFS